MIEHGADQSDEVPTRAVESTRPDRRRLPWRGALAGAVVAVAVVAAVRPFDGEAAWWGLFLLTPVLVLGWAGTAAATLVVFDARNVMAVVTLSVIPGGGWLLDLPHDAGSMEWPCTALTRPGCSAEPSYPHGRKGFHPNA